jgi:hypothetical protein
MSGSTATPPPKIFAERARAAGLAAAWESRRAEVEAAIATADRLSQALARYALTPAEEPMPSHAAPLPSPPPPAVAGQ